MQTMIGARIKKFRLEHNLSKARFGALIGVSGQHIGKLEKGAGLSVELIVCICRVMAVSADYLLFGNSDPATVSVALKGMSQAQMEIALDILKRVARMIKAEDGDEMLIQEVWRQQDMHSP